MRGRSIRRCLFVLAYGWTTLGCELANTAPSVIPGPTVPSRAPLQSLYTWDGPEELADWIDNPVSRGSFRIDSSDSNGAIVIQRVRASSGPVVLRGPNLDPPASSIRTVRIRYQWTPEVSIERFMLWGAVDVTKPPVADGQLKAPAFLNGGPDWKDIDFPFPSAAPYDGRYVYFWSYTTAIGVLKIDTISLVRQGL